MSLNNYLSKSGIEWSSVSESIGRYLSYVFLEDEQILTKRYIIPVNDTYEYCYIDLSSNKNKALMSGMAVKTDSANIDFVVADEYTGEDDTNVDKFIFAYHGNGIILETNTEELTEGPLVVAVKTYSKSILDNINKDLEDVLKQCYGYLYNDDTDSFYLALQKLSEVKSNIIADNKETKNIIKKHYATIGLNSFTDVR